MVKGKQVNVNAGDYDMRTALHVASSEGHIEVVQFLVSQGANVNAVDRFGNAPIDGSVQAEMQHTSPVLLTLLLLILKKKFFFNFKKRLHPPGPSGRHERSCRPRCREAIGCI